MSADIRMVPWSIAKWGMMQLHQINDMRYQSGTIDRLEHLRRSMELAAIAAEQLKGRNWLCDRGYLPESERGK